MKEDMMDTHVVGYRKPPKHTQFRKGVSGNRRGRPKGKRNFTTILKEALDEQIVIKEKGVRKTVTKLEAAVRRLADKAASGDLMALKQMTALLRSVEEPVTEPSAKPLAEEDLKIIQRLLQKEGPARKEISDESH